MSIELFNIAEGVQGENLQDHELKSWVAWHGFAKKAVCWGPGKRWHFKVNLGVTSHTRILQRDH